MLAFFPANFKTKLRSFFFEDIEPILGPSGGSFLLSSGDLLANTCHQVVDDAIEEVKCSYTALSDLTPDREPVEFFAIDSNTAFCPIIEV